ncbi:VCBS repeat-containing protein, partial [Thiocapsa sp.]|uniref:FG-GAP repeat domain-containing protein n=1 Tax=Thiocapsa sp. TaxID=2024551 RepID=UPI002B791991
MLILLAATSSLPLAAEPGIAFVDWSSQVGLDYRAQTWGASWRDFDEDGFVDLFVSHHFTYPEPFKFAPILQAPASLYRNDRAIRFRDIGPEMLGRTPGDWHGATWADVDNDGDVDLLVARGGSSGLLQRGPISDRDRLLNTNLMFIREKDGFVERGEAMGLALPWQRGRRPVWFDVDLDGRLDVLFAQVEPSDPSDVLYRQDADGRFSPCALPGLTNADSAGVAYLFRGFESGERHLQLSGAPGRLYRVVEDADCRFEEIPADPGLGARHTYDMLLADLTGDLSLDYFGPTKTGGSYFRQTTPQLISIGLPGKESLSRLDFRVEGEAMVIIRPASGPNGWTDGSRQRTFLGQSGSAPTGHQFTLDPDDTRFHGHFADTPQAAGFHIWLDPTTKLWSIAVNKPEPMPFSLELIGTDRIEVPGGPPSMAPNPTGASDVLYVQGRRTWTRTPGDHGLGALSTSCVSAVA